MRVNYEELKSMTKAEAESLFQHAFGRILRMGSRPGQPGDAEDYETCKHIIYHCADRLGLR